MSTAKKITITVAGIIILLIAVIAFLVLWRGSSKEILSAANKFQAPSSWKLESEMVRPPAFLCLDGGTCPEVSRTWTVDDEINEQKLNNLIEKTGWHLPQVNQCTLPQNASGKSVTLCSTEGTVKKYSIAVWLNEDSSSHQQTVVLSVRPE